MGFQEATNSRISVETRRDFYWLLLVFIANEILKSRNTVINIGIFFFFLKLSTSRNTMINTGNFFSFFFLGLHLRHMDVPRLGV